jgi:hypothetical protein
MTLSPKSLLVRYAYLLTNKTGKPGHVFGPDTTTLCRLFWRILLTTVALAIFAAWAGTILFMLVKYPLEFLGTIGSVLALGFGAAGFAMLHSKLSRKDLYKFLKGKLCPLISFEE